MCLSQHINSLLHSRDTKSSLVCCGLVHVEILILCERCRCIQCWTVLHNGKFSEKNLIPAQSMQPFRACISEENLSFCPRDLLVVRKCRTLSFFDPRPSGASPVKDAATAVSQSLCVSVMCEYERGGL